MSCKHRRDQLTSFLFVVTVYLFNFQVSHSVSLGPRGEELTAYKVEESTASRERIKRDEDVQRGDRDAGEPAQGPRPRKYNRPRRTVLRPESAVFPAEPVPFHSAPTLNDNLSWTVGKVRPGPRASAADSEHGYQADFTGFRGVQGKVLGPSFESSSHLSEWLAMNPVVQCDDGVMTFTASGKESRHLFVDRESASPVSLFQLPPYCRYSVRKSRRDLEMMVPYDACYVTQQNGSYVLPMKWWGSPLKLSCPVQAFTPAPSVSNSALSVLCSSYGMAVQINGLNQDVQILGVIVKERWSPFVSEECAYHVTSHTGTLTFFIPYGAPCITSGNGLHLLLNYQEYIFSCPLNSQFPYIPSPPKLPTQEQMARLPGIPHSPYPGFQYPRLLQVYPPAPQPTQTTVAQATSAPNINPVQESSPHQFSKLPVGSSEYASGWYFPYMPFYSPAATPAPTSAAKESTTTTTAVPPESPNYPWHYWHMPYYPLAPGTQAPSFDPSQHPAPTSAAKESTTTTTTVAVPPASPNYPWYYRQMPYYHAAPEAQALASFDPSQHPAPTSAAKESTTTTTTTTAVPPASPNYPWYYRHMPYYPLAPGTQAPSFDPSQHPAPTSAAKESTTTTTTTTTIAVPPASPNYPWYYRQMPYYHAAPETQAPASFDPSQHPAPTSAAKESTTTTTTAVPLTSPNYPWYYRHMPYYPAAPEAQVLASFDPSQHPAPTSAAIETTTTPTPPTTPTAAAVPPASPNYPWYYRHMPYHPAAPETQAPASFDPSQHPAPTSAAKESTTTTTAAVPPASPNYPWYYRHMPYHPAAPETQAPASFDPSQHPAPTSAAKESTTTTTAVPQTSPNYPWYYRHMPYYPAAPEAQALASFDPSQHPAPTSAAIETTTTPTPPTTTTAAAVPPASPNYPWYYRHMPYHPAAPETQAPASFDPSQHPVRGALHSPDSHSAYPYGKFFYPGLEVQPASSSHPISPPSPLPPTTTVAPTQPSSPSYPSGQFPAQTPICFPMPTTLLPAKETVALQANSPPDARVICSPYPYPYYHPLYPPPYHPPYQSLTQDPETRPPITTITAPPTTSSTASTTAGPTSPIAHLQCLVGRLVVFLPFAHSDTIQVRDQKETWLLVSGVSPLCGYMLQSAEGYGVILHSPLPACHSQLPTPTTISLNLRFWDLSMALYRSVDLQCPYPTTNETPVPVTPPVSPTPPSTTEEKVDPTVVPKSKVYCSSHQMTVELPSGPFSGIAFKDIKGNQMSFQDAPEHCGYSARKGKDGKIRLTIQLLSRCHMSVQGNMYMITVVYMTVNGRREAPFSCPVVIPGSGQECNLPSEQHLPCGPSAVSEPQCRSMGCCFNSHPPACYYPMDECTIDRHFIFSVSASLTEPPLSPGLLVVAGNSTCKPQRVTADYALFKIPMDGCGTRRVAVGNAVIYMVEVINQVQPIRLNYGAITRDSPVRVLVECRFVPGAALSVSYLVKTPTLGPEVPAQGMFGVQLRIAKDAEYSSYYPQNHPPLQMLLGKPLYLEVRLLDASDPSLVLLVHFCVAYPLSGKAVWLLLYNGCPNPMDPALQQAVLSSPRPPTPQAQTRRFTVSTFQFLPDGESMDPDEENNFMCSTEICSPRDGPCVEGCFGQ